MPQRVTGILFFFLAFEQRITHDCCRVDRERYDTARHDGDRRQTAKSAFVFQVVVSPVDGFLIFVAVGVPEVSVLFSFVFKTSNTNRRIVATQAIETLARAGIKIWVLTGTGVEQRDETFVVSLLLF